MSYSIRVLPNPETDNEEKMEYLVVDDRTGAVISPSYKTREQAESRIATLESVVDQGQFNGKIIEIAYGLVKQSFGMGKAVFHKESSLSRIPILGEVEDIKYVNGLGKVKDRNHERGISR